MKYFSGMEKLFVEGNWGLLEYGDLHRTQNRRRKSMPAAAADSG
jgi:hypothetical protein